MISVLTIANFKILTDCQKTIRTERCTWNIFSRSCRYEVED